MKIATLMHEDVKCCRPEDTLETAASLMWSFDIGALPVIDADARVVGMITDRDICIAAYRQGHCLAEIPVAVAMTRQVVACHRDDDLATARTLMADNRIRRLPVIDDDGRVEGILTIDDLAVGAESGAGVGLSRAEVAGTLAAICAGREAPPLPALP